MKNFDLIRQLMKYNLDADVVLVDSEDIELSYIDNDGKFTMDTTPIIFIEGCDIDEDY